MPSANSELIFDNFEGKFKNKEVISGKINRFEPEFKRFDWQFKNDEKEIQKYKKRGESPLYNWTQLQNKWRKLQKASICNFKCIIEPLKNLHRTFKEPIHRTFKRINHRFERTNTNSCFKSAICHFKRMYGSFKTSSTTSKTSTTVKHSQPFAAFYLFLQSRSRNI